MITSFTIDSLVIGTVASGYHLTRLNGFGMPVVEVNVKQRGSYHGGILGQYNYGRRELSIEGEIIGSSLSDFNSKRRAIEQAFTLFDGLKTLSIETKDSLSLQVDVMIKSAFNAPYERGRAVIGDFRAELVAPYPYIESQAQVTTELSVFDGGGWALPIELPFDMSAGGTGAEIIANNGNGNAYPTVTIIGAIENPSLQNTTTSKNLSINYTLNTSTDYIELDFYNRTALANGTTNILQYVSGDWWTLAPGNNTVKLFAGSAGATALATMLHRHAYLGL